MRDQAQNLIGFVKKNLNGHTTKMRDLANKFKEEYKVMVASY